MNLYQTGNLQNASLIIESLVKLHHEQLNLKVEPILTVPSILALRSPSSESLSLPFLRENIAEHI